MRIQQTVINSLLIIALLTLASCGGVNKTKPSADTPSDGGYYLDDGPDAVVPADLDKVPNARPKPEPYSTRANKPYRALGKIYTPMTSYMPYKKQGVASWYGKRYHGKKTSVGEVYDMYAMTAAHTTLPIPSYAKVTNKANGRSVIVRINDRGPFIDGREIDLSYVAAHQLRMVQEGSALVEVEAIDHRYETLEKTATPAADPDTINETYPLVEPSTNNVEVSDSTTVQSREQTLSAGFYLQVGAYKNVENSQKLIKKIAGFSRSSDVQILDVYNDNVHRVKVGPYITRAAAEAAASQIQSQYGIDPLIQQSN